MVSDFYKSTEWRKFREIIIAERGNICEHCGKTIVAKGDTIIHHTPIELTEFNYQDVSISLNPENVKIVCASCHNLIHNKRGVAGKSSRQIFVVFGPACSGKTTYVRDHADRNALILDVDKLYQAMSINNLYNKSDRLTDNVMQVRSCILDMIRTKKGKWSDAYIIIASCNPIDLKRYKQEYNATFIEIECDKQICIDRAITRDTPQSVEYINNYFDQYDKYKKIIKEITAQ